jgi:alkanesulfonate monooxygenase SsuD/methylene tetrahydromethanopterin reductase-like flavin-dependent oxidoreductase (luciferase family)
MTDYGHELRFGVFVVPEAARAAEVVELAVLAEAAGLDYVTFQDHPYQARFLDTWTLLSVIAARTTSIRLAPNVVNLPLRLPSVLARSVATLDLLSGGRIELGLGAGAFWDGVAAMGGPRRSPGESVDALSEAIDVVRALWDTSQSSVGVEGDHYRVVGAHPGPAPAHRVELWLGAYKPRMLALTGAKGDGWVPSLAYLELDQLPEMNRRIDEAAIAAGRGPADIRRVFNIASELSDPRRLAELTLATGMSTYLMAVSSAREIQGFAQEVAPAVRELVEAGRRAPETARPPSPPAHGRATPFAAEATADDGTRLSPETAWDESTRPTGPAPEPGRLYTPDEQAAGRHLIDVHDALRAELTQLRDLVAQVAAGTASPAGVRSFITRMTIRQNNWTLGTFCETYCRVVTHHHTLEDRSVFPHLRHSEPGLAAVLDRLHAEHETIAELLERVDAALIDLVSGEGLGGVQASVDLLTDALLSHFSYEERELIEPLARHSFS